MALLTSFTARFVIVCFLSSLGAAQAISAAERTEVSPAWRVDLRASIGGEPLGLVVGRGRETRGKPRTSLWFLDDSTIAVTFVTRASDSGLSTRKSTDQSLPLRLRVLLLDAASGKVRNTLAWPTASRFAGIVATHDGKFVTQRGRDLTLFSSDLKEVKNLELPLLDDGDWHAHPSPSGRNILFVATNLKTALPVPWLWVETDNLAVVRSWKAIQSGWVSISDHNMAMTTCVWVYSCEPDVQVRSIEGNWGTVAPASRHDRPRPQFVNDDLYSC
jgi:hypothetical protein